MYLYLIFFSISFFSIFESSRNIFFKKKTLTLFFLILFLLSFLRWERGTDWESYLISFELITTWNTKTQFEFLYGSLMKFVKLNLNGNFTLFLFFSALIIYLCNYITISKYAKYPLLSLLVWYSFSFGGIFFTRQLIAVSIIFYSIQFIIKRKLFFFILSVLIAMLFHRTSIVFIIAYFIYNLNYSRRKIIITLSIFSVLGLIFTSGLLSTISGFVGGVFYQRIEAYKEIGTSSSFASNYSPLETLIRGSLYRVAVIVYILIYHFEYYKKDSFFRGIFNLYITGCLLFFVMAPISPTLVRFSLFFEIFQVFIYPYFIFHKKNKTLRVFSTCVLILYLLFRFYGVVQTYRDLYIPYKSVFNKSLPVKVY